MQPSFSVVIPTLNEEKYVPKLLNDLSKQKKSDFEVVLVDGGSSDKTNEVVELFKEKLKLRTFIVKKKNVAYQRNFGASHSSGNYLIFLDADSRINPSFIANLTKFIEKKKGLIFLPYVDPEENNQSIKAFFKFTNTIIDITQNTARPFSSVGGMVWEKNLFHLVGGFNEDVFVAEDYNIVYKAHCWGVKAKFMPDIKVKFSFRRIKREGRLTSIYKMLSSTVIFLIKGEIKDKIYDYEMGGHLYNKKKTENTLVVNTNLKQTLTKLFADIFKE